MNVTVIERARSHLNVVANESDGATAGDDLTSPRETGRRIDTRRGSYDGTNEPGNHSQESGNN